MQVLAAEMPRIYKKVLMDVDEVITLKQIANTISSLAELECVSSEDIYPIQWHSCSIVTLPIISVNKMLRRGKLRIG